MEERKQEDRVFDLGGIINTGKFFLAVGERGKGKGGHLHSKPANHLATSPSYHFITLLLYHLTTLLSYHFTLSYFPLMILLPHYFYYFTTSPPHHPTSSLSFNLTILSPYHLNILSTDSPSSHHLITLFLTTALF